MVWVFRPLGPGEEICLVLLNQKDGDRCWFLGIGTRCIYWRGYIYNEQKNIAPSKLYELISFLIYSMFKALKNVYGIFAGGPSAV